MHICRFTLKADAKTRPRVGLMEGDNIRDVTSVTEELPPLHWPIPPGDQFIANLGRLRPRMEAVASGAPVIPRSDVRLLSPVANPGKFICGVGNWPQHKAPLGMLGFLFKMTSAMAGEGEGVQLRWPDRVTVHEAELAWVIGRECVNVSAAEALDYVAGYTCALDMTLKEEKEFFTFCKSFDTYGVLGPCLVTTDQIPDPAELGYRFLVNGEFKHGRSFGELTAGPAQMVAFASTVMTLHPGDVIFSGTSEVGPVVPGDIMTIEIPRVGRMDVPVSLSPKARKV
ncbi:MAG: FAA hydrolase family protein [Rhodospirillaceae bacterium]|nr:MAG: FAA hydrolase family protein [Rhodospirillaceae bacterium]